MGLCLVVGDYWGWQWCLEGAIGHECIDIRISIKLESIWICKLIV